MKTRIRVAGLAINNDSILLVKHTVNGEHFWIPPGGGLEGYEIFEECAARETIEETGLVVRVGTLAYINEFHSHLHDTDHLELFLSLKFDSIEVVTGSDPDASPWGPLIIDVGWISKDELLSGFPDRVSPAIIATSEFWEQAADGFPHTEYIGLQTDTAQ